MLKTECFRNPAGLRNTLRKTLMSVFTMCLCQECCIMLVFAIFCVSISLL